MTTAVTEQAKPPTLEQLLTAPVPGIYRAMPSEVYHAMPAASNTRLGKLRKSPAHLKAYIDRPDEDTPATIVGRASHCAVFEPDEFDARFMTAEQCEAKTKEGNRCKNMGGVRHPDRGWLCGTHAKMQDGREDGRAVLTPDQFKMCIGIRDSVHHSKFASQLLRDPQQERELSIVWSDPLTGVMCKARLDVHSPTIGQGGRGGIIDLKTTVDASERAFERSIWNHGYHIQGAMYLDGALAVGMEAHHFVHVAVEKEPPYAIAIYRLKDDVIATGREQVRGLLERYATCLRDNVWPAYPEEIRDIGVPQWAWSIIDEELAAMTKRAAA